MLESFLQHSCFPVDIGKFSTPPILENMCERLLLNVVFNSNVEQYWFAKIDEAKHNYILYLFVLLSYLILYYTTICYYDVCIISRSGRTEVVFKNVF